MLSKEQIISGLAQFSFTADDISSHVTHSDNIWNVGFRTEEIISNPFRQTPKKTLA